MAIKFSDLVSRLSDYRSTIFPKGEKETKFTSLLGEISDKAEENLPKEKKSLDWFMMRAKSVRKEAVSKTDVKPAQILQDTKPLLLNIKQFPITTKNDARTMIGRMFLYNYDAKHKATLPYYDAYPVMFPIRLDPKGMLGINLHYLPLSYRASLMDALYSLLNTKTIQENSRIKLSYDILSASSRYKAFRPCVKQYLYTHVRSRFMMIPPEHWDTVLFLPLAQWKKADQTTVWRDSRNLINK
jgi:hypothetical protein